MQYTDAHVHLIDLAEKFRADSVSHFGLVPVPLTVVDSCHSAEALAFSELVHLPECTILRSFGVHPLDLSAMETGLKLLKKLAQDRRIAAVGECGYDFYDESAVEPQDIQKQVFEAQVKIAQHYQLPLILHVRKALPLLLSEKTGLEAVKAVVFHCFSGSAEEAKALLKKGINAYFSFGTPILKGNKKAEQACISLPVERLLFETDAPFQPVKGKNYTSFEELPFIVQKAAELREITSETMLAQADKNFADVFFDK